MKSLDDFQDSKLVKELTENQQLNAIGGSAWNPLDGWKQDG